MCGPGFYQFANGLMVTQPLGNMMYGWTVLYNIKTDRETGRQADRKK